MAFGVLSAREVRRLVRESGGVTFAVAALTSAGAVLAADSLETQLVGGRFASQDQARKVAGGNSWGVLVSGVSTVSGQPLLPQLAAAVDGADTLIGAVHAVHGLLEQAFGPLLPHVPQLLAVHEVLSDVVIARQPLGGSWEYGRIKYYRKEDAVDVSARTWRPDPGTILTLVAGAPHPALQVLSDEYAADHAEVALIRGMTQMAPPSAPARLPAVGIAAAVREVLEAAIKTQQLARRPQEWPDGAPVAAGPVQTVVLGRVP